MGRAIEERRQRWWWKGTVGKSPWLCAQLQSDLMSLWQMTQSLLLCLVAPPCTSHPLGFPRGSDSEVLLPSRHACLTASHLHHSYLGCSWSCWSPSSHRQRAAGRQKWTKLESPSAL